MHKIGDQLRRLREAAGLSQKAVATALEIDQSTVSKWENSQREPSFDDLARLRELYQPRITTQEMPKGTEGILDPMPSLATPGTRVSRPRGAGQRPGGAGNRQVPVSRIVRQGLGAGTMEAKAFDFLEICGPLASHEGLWATVCPDEYLVPAVDPGDVVVASPAAPLRRGVKLALVKKTGEAFLCEYVQSSPPGTPDQTITVKFLNPESTITLPATEVAKADTIVAIFKA